MNLPKIKAMQSSRGNTVPNQNMIFHDGERTFQSYGRNIVHVSKTHVVTLDEYYWDYSQTTGKYRNDFLGEKKADTQRKIDSGEYKLANLN
jgi:hypothetical protein